MVVASPDDENTDNGIAGSVSALVNVFTAAVAVATTTGVAAISGRITDVPRIVSDDTKWPCLVIPFSVRKDTN